MEMDHTHCRIVNPHTIPRRHMHTLTLTSFFVKHHVRVFSFYIPIWLIPYLPGLYLLLRSHPESARTGRDGPPCRTLLCVKFGRLPNAHIHVALGTHSKQMRYFVSIMYRWYDMLHHHSHFISILNYSSSLTTRMYTLLHINMQNGTLFIRRPRKMHKILTCNQYENCKKVMELLMGFYMDNVEDTQQYPSSSVAL